MTAAEQHYNEAVELQQEGRVEEAVQDAHAVATWVWKEDTVTMAWHAGPELAVACRERPTAACLRLFGSAG